MKLENEQTIDEALARYAVLLNRPAWLDPSRLELQREAWLALVDQYGQKRDGLLTTTDLAQAITKCLARIEPRDVLPSAIVEQAVVDAIARSDKAKLVIGLAPELTIAEQNVRLHDRMSHAKDADERGRALAAFHAAVADVMQTLALSGLDRDVVEPVMARIKQQAATITKAANRPEIEP